METKIPLSVGATSLIKATNRENQMLPKHIVDGTRARIGFSKYELDLTSCTIEELNALLLCPEEGTPCRVFPSTCCAGSAFAQMNEPALNGGFLRTDEGLKVLAIFTERPVVDCKYEFGFYLIARVKHLKQLKLAKVF